MRPEPEVRPEPEAHICQVDPGEKMRILKQIRTLMEKIGNAPCIPQPPMPPAIDFLCEKHPRFRPDPEDVPVITHVPLIELRPSSDYRKLKKTAYQWRNIHFVPVDPPQSQHASPPWRIADPLLTRAEHELPCPKRNCVCCPHLKKFKMKQN